MIKTRADLFEAAAKMMRMCDEAGIMNYQFKLDGMKDSALVNYTFNMEPPCRYEFPLAVVEGNPVFVGDELYDQAGIKYVAGFAKEQEAIWAKPDTPFLYGKSNSGQLYFCQLENAISFSWNPPKPKIIMVELPYADVEYWATFNSLSTHHQKSANLYDSCKKALEK